MMNIREAISERVAMLCREQAMTLEQLLEKVNADPDTVIEVIKGDNHFAQLDLMREISIALGITMPEFFNHSLFKDF